MNFLDFFDFFTELPLIKGDKEKRPKIYVLFNILLIIGLFWFTIRLKTILDSRSPILFILLFTVIGLILTIGIIISIYKIGLIEKLTTKDFFTVFIPVVLITISLADFIASM